MTMINKETKRFLFSFSKDKTLPVRSPARFRAPETIRTSKILLLLENLRQLYRFCYVFSVLTLKGPIHSVNRRKISKESWIKKRQRSKDLCNLKHRTPGRTDLGLFVRWGALFLTLLLTVPFAFGQGKISYIYPAGGQQGTTFEIVVSGNGVNAETRDVFVTGEGVTVTFLRACFSEPRFTGPGTRPVFDYLFQKAMNRCWPDKFREPKELIRIENPKPDDPVYVPEEKICDDFPWCSFLRSDTNLDLQKKMLQKIYYEYMTGKVERQRPLRPFIFYQVKIAPDAKPGLREFRFFQKKGTQKLSAPFFFEITPYREVLETEPNDSLALSIKGARGRWGYPYNELTRTAEETPVVFNGQVNAGEWDCHAFKAIKGQKLVLGVKGRSIVPYMADAVPGWFSPMITLFGPNGKEIKIENRFRFSTDPILFFEVPDDGIYQLEIRDVIYRGREDFVYRLFVGEIPFVFSTSTIGTVKNTDEVQLQGWNLPTETIDLRKVKKANKKDEKIFGEIEEDFWQVDSLGNVWLPWPLRFANDKMTAYNEEFIRAKAKESGREKIVLKTPVIIDGLLSQDGEEDVWFFKGDIGEKIVLEVVASQLGSPVEPGVELVNANGEILVRGDDRAGAAGPNIGQETHHADPLTGYSLTESGEYAVRVFNVYGKGGPEYRYRLRISRPKPDYEVFATPSFINPGQGNSFQVKIDVIRKDGFTGPIKLYAKSIDGLFTVDGDIQEGVSSQYSTVTANSNFKDLSPFYMLAASNVGKRTIARLVTPCEDMEQAFIYHHAIPCHSFSIYKPGRSDLFFWPEEKDPIELSPGTLVKCVLFLPDLPEPDPKKAQKKPVISQTLNHHLGFDLKEPKGVILEKFDVRENDRKVDLYFKLDQAGDLWRKAPPKGNLIVNLSATRKSKESGAQEKIKLNDRGPLPAIAYVISETPSKKIKKSSRSTKKTKL